MLTVEDLSYSYGSTNVFSGTSFEIFPGEIAFLVGENGSGKSTLLRCLAGWARPADGVVLLDGKSFDPSDRAMRGDVAFVPDTPVFYDDMTANEHLAFVRQANRAPREEDPSPRLMHILGLSAYGDRIPATYSRGMKLKLAVVLALASRPKVLLLDEPYGPLDPSARGVLSALLKEYLDGGMAAVVSCHHEVPGIDPDLILGMGAACGKMGGAVG
ncbi:ABC transporter ATP-binding protein [Enteroscipio rubneri]|uniref:ABC transporter ATP-binding protein n=1 Tax=Enteroscipio rubneri TaxID=2070686 RepID=UPI003AEFDB8D